MNFKQVTLENGVYYDGNNQPISNEEMTDILTEAQTIPIETLAFLALLLKNGDISPDEWEERTQEEIKKAYIRNMILGAGGEQSINQDDVNALTVFLIGGSLFGRTIVGQFKFLNDFKNDISNLAELQIRARSQMYINSSRQMFSFIQGRRLGVPILLPAYPGDGSTECYTNCHCHWEHLFNQFREWIGSNWVLGVADHCPTCVERSIRWKPYTP